MNISKISRPLKRKSEQKVAAYTRVSVDTSDTRKSLLNQIDYYTKLIEANPAWEYVGVYADLGISGTSRQKRKNFEKLIKDCEDGKIDIVLTKSISRFARNTVDLLAVVRKLKSMSVAVHFERENINTLSADGELLLSLLASFAQEESRSLSENIKWGMRKKFTKGIPNTYKRLLGYEWVEGKLVVIESEAKVVKYIFAQYLAGRSLYAIADELNAMGAKTITGRPFRYDRIKNILENYTYTGNLLLQKCYIADPISKKVVRKQTDLPQYLVENSHQGLISVQEYEKVQQLIYINGAKARKTRKFTCFTGKILCGVCGKTYTPCDKKFFGCSSSKRRGQSCGAKSVPQSVVKELFCEILKLESFDQEIFKNKVSYIEITDPQTITFNFKTGKTIIKTWIRKRGKRQE